MRCDLHGGNEQSVALRIPLGEREWTICILCITRIMEAWHKTVKGNFGGFIRKDSEP